MTQVLPLKYVPDGHEAQFVSNPIQVAQDRSHVLQTPLLTKHPFGQVSTQEFPFKKVPEGHEVQFVADPVQVSQDRSHGTHIPLLG